MANVVARASGHTASMALAAGPQTHCDHCQGSLRPEAAYCENCGRRTRRAKRLVRISIRAELALLALFVVLVVVFTFVLFVQK